MSEVILRQRPVETKLCNYCQVNYLVLELYKQFNKDTGGTGDITDVYHYITPDGQRILDPLCCIKETFLILEDKTKRIYRHNNNTYTADRLLIDASEQRERSVESICYLCANKLIKQRRIVRNGLYIKNLLVLDERTKNSLIYETTHENLIDMKAKISEILAFIDYELKYREENGIGI